MKYREIGDVPYSVWLKELERVGSPLLPYSRAMYDVLKGHTALAMAQMWQENQYETDRDLLRFTDYNHWNMKEWPEDPRGMWGIGAIGTKPTGVGGPDYLVFESPIRAAQEWRRRVIDDPNYVRVGWVNNQRVEYRYTPDMTLEQYIATFALPSEKHPTTGEDNTKYFANVVTMLKRYGVWKEDEPVASITYGNVPMFGYVDKYIKNKREGFGWDDLGQREVWFVTIHRMLGDMAGTLSHFNNPNVSSITDYAIGVEAMDGKKMAGVIYRYNDPQGRRSGWASGPVKKPFGDGKALVDKYGVNVVNRNGASIEVSGHQNTPVDAVAWQELVHFIAYWADQAKVPWDTFPLNPKTGISFVVWHAEFTGDEEKECPFKWMRDNTPRLIKDVAAFLKGYQTKLTTPQEPTIPKPPVPEVPPLAEFLFGKVGTYSFNPNGPVSKLWLKNANETGSFPRLIDVREGTPKYFVFSDGSVIVDNGGKLDYLLKV